MKIIVGILLLGPFLLGLTAHADTFDILDYHALVGNRSEFVNDVQTDVGGEKNGVFNWDIYGAIGAETQLYNDASLFFEIGMNFPRSGEDGNINRWKLWAHFLPGYHIYDFVIKLGFGFEWIRLSGPGGVETLNNGTSQSSFPLPEGATYSTNLVLVPELEYYINKEVSTRLDLLVYNPFAEYDRSYTWKISFVYHIGPNIFY